MNKKIHYQADVLEHFIPISLDKLISDLLATKLISSEQQKEFIQLYKGYTSLFHAQTQVQLQHLKQTYHPFNPDREVLITEKNQGSKLFSQFKSEIYTLIESANFTKLSEQALNEAMNKVSPHGVKVSVDFDEFNEVALFYRGSAIRTELRRNWKKFPFKKEEREMPIYRRLFVLLQPKNKQQWIDHLISKKKFSHKKAKKKADDTFEELRISGKEDLVYLKLFKDIPSADMEMLFPNTRVRMRLFDKIKLSVVGGGGTIGGIMATITKLSATIEPLSALIAIGGLLGVLWRQIAKIFSQRAKYSAILTKNLYFYSLNNNMSALTHLIDTAETEECKEALLAYFFLLAYGESTRDDLDKRIESYIFEKYAIPMDFEINDGLNKLEKTRLLSSLPSDTKNLISAVSLPEANARLKQQWINLIES